MGTDGFTPEQVARWSPELRQHAQADESLYTALLNGRETSALDYTEARTLAAAFASTNPITGKPIKAGSRTYRNRHTSCYQRLRSAQTPEGRRAWDNAEMNRARAFVANAPAKPLTTAQKLEAQYGKVPAQRHHKYNASCDRRRYA